MPEPTPTKTCRKCGVTRPTDDFPRLRSSKDGLYSYCKPCTRADKKAWAAKNAEKLREYGRRHYLENREAYIARAQMHKGIKNPLGRRRFPLAPDGWKFCSDCNYLLPLEEFYEDAKSADSRTYRCKECANSLRYNLMTRAARARARAGDGLPFTACDMLRLYKQQRGRCFYCGQPLRKDFALDHVVPITKGGGNEEGNVVCACPQCNYLKADLDVEEFRRRHLRAT